MKLNQFSTLTNEELLKIYETSAKAHGEALENGAYKIGNKAHDQLAAAYRTLRSRGDAAREGILPFLKSDNLHLRSWAAAHALEFCPEAGEPVLQELVDAKIQLISFTAEMVLSQWREGALKFP